MPKREMFFFKNSLHRNIIQDLSTSKMTWKIKIHQGRKFSHVDYFYYLEVFYYCYMVKTKSVQIICPCEFLFSELKLIASIDIESKLYFKNKIQTPSMLLSVGNRKIILDMFIVMQFLSAFFNVWLAWKIRQVIKTTIDKVWSAVGWVKLLQRMTKCWGLYTYLGGKC